MKAASGTPSRHAKINLISYNTVEGLE